MARSTQATREADLHRAPRAIQRAVGAAPAERSPVLGAAGSAASVEARARVVSEHPPAARRVRVAQPVRRVAPRALRARRRVMRRRSAKAGWSAKTATMKSVDLTTDLKGQVQNWATWAIEVPSGETIKPVDDVVFTQSVLTFSAPVTSCQPSQAGTADYFSAPVLSADGLHCCFDKVILRANRM